MKAALPIVAFNVPPLKFSSDVGLAFAGATPPMASVPPLLRFITFNVPAVLAAPKSKT